MPSSPISLLITTASLYLLLLSLVASFSVLSRWILRNAYEIQLAEVANHVAENMVGMRALLHLSSENDTVLLKGLDLPKDLLHLGYAIRIEDMGEVLFIVAYLEMDASVFSRSPLWRKDDQVRIETESGTFESDDFLVSFGPELHSGQRDAVVWARWTTEGLSVGLGALEQ